MLGELAALSDVGRDPTRGGYSRHGFDAAELSLREWFTEAAGRRGLDVETDHCGNQWAWWCADAGADAVVTGSHLDSVPGGGAFDGPLGVVSALLAVDQLRAGGFTPRRPLAVAVFAEEEGGRFGVPCLGSRLLTGALEPAVALGLRDDAGVTLAEAVGSAGLDPAAVTAEPDRVAGIGVFVELHVEQGRGLAQPVGVASSIIAHGRWRFRFTGQGNHAGTTAIMQRRDPMVPTAALVLAARRCAAAAAAGAPGSVAGPVATVGRVRPMPGGTNVIASTVDAWLDARAATDADTRSLVEEITHAARDAATAEGCTLQVTAESVSGAVMFDPALRDELAGLLGGVPSLPTGAGHDAGVLAAHVPTAMLFVRNPTGISHAPQEHAEQADCAAGVDALARVLQHLAG